MFNVRLLWVSVLLSCLFTFPNTTPAYRGDGIIEQAENPSDELRRAAQNPMADLISFPVQNNINFDFGPLEKTQNVTNIQTTSGGERCKGTS